MKTPNVQIASFWDWSRATYETIVRPNLNRWPGWNCDVISTWPELSLGDGVFHWTDLLLVDPGARAIMSRGHSSMTGISISIPKTNKKKTRKWWNNSVTILKNNETMFPEEICETCLTEMFGALEDNWLGPYKVIGKVSEVHYIQIQWSVTIVISPQ